MPTPPSRFIIRVAEVSRVKAQERQRGPVLDPPFSAVTGPSRGPKAQITPHIMRDLAQQALPLFLSLSLCCSHIETQTEPLRYYCWSPALFRSLVVSDNCQHSCFTCPCTVKGNRQSSLLCWFLYSVCAIKTKWNEKCYYLIYKT